MKCIPALIAAVGPLNLRARPQHRALTHKLHSLFVVSTLSIAAAFPAPAAADSYFNGYLSNLQYTLTDLDAADGIAPSISFDVSADTFTDGLLDGKAADSGTVTGASGSLIRKAELDRFNFFRSAIFFKGDPISNGDPLVMSVAGASNVLTNGGLDGSNGNFRAQSSAGNAFSLGFTLSARTAVRFTVDYWMEVRANINPSDGFLDSASLSANIFADAFSTSDESGAGIASINFEDDSGGVSVAASNLTTASQLGYFYATIKGDAFDYGLPQAAPVPEPETYALMLAGLAAIGLMARRRT